jgi:predicted site-specific integrase-resolvase
MKAQKVLKLLQITRQTLTKYVKNGILEVEILGNGRYNYLDESVYKFLNKEISRKTVIYARVSTPKQKKDLANQVELLKTYCLSNGIKINEVYQDIASGISFENRQDFFKLLDEVINHRIDKVIITYKDRMSRVGFGLFKHLFENFGTEIIVISEIGSKTLDSKEVFDEIVSLLHCYSMKLYSSRKRKLIKELVDGGE